MTLSGLRESSWHVLMNFHVHLRVYKAKNLPLRNSNAARVLLGSVPPAIWCKNVLRTRERTQPQMPTFSPSIIDDHELCICHSLAHGRRHRPILSRISAILSSTIVPISALISSSLSTSPPLSSPSATPSRPTTSSMPCACQKSPQPTKSASASPKTNPHTPFESESPDGVLPLIVTTLDREHALVFYLNMPPSNILFDGPSNAKIVWDSLTDEQLFYRITARPRAAESSMAPTPESLPACCQYLLILCYMTRSRC